MQFIGGLFEMANGPKMVACEADGRFVRIDKATGEVTLKFKAAGILESISPLIVFLVALPFFPFVAGHGQGLVDSDGDVLVLGIYQVV